MRAYSLDFRRHVLAAIERGTPKPEAAQVFGISVRTINRYLQQLAETESLAAKPPPGRVRQLPPAQHPALEAQLRAHPDATLADHCGWWATDHGVQLSLATMHRAIRRLGWTRKKRHWWPPNALPTNARSGATPSVATIPPSSSFSTNPAPM